MINNHPLSIFNRSESLFWWYYLADVLCLASWQVENVAGNPIQPLIKGNIGKIIFALGNLARSGVRDVLR